MTHCEHGDRLRVEGNLQVDQCILDPEHDVVVEVGVIPQRVECTLEECSVDVLHHDLDALLEGHLSEAGPEHPLPVEAKDLHDLDEDEPLDFTPGELRDEEVQVEDADVAASQLHCKGNQAELVVREDLELSAVSQE